MPAQSFLLGTAPFCSPNPEQCYVTIGYQPTGRQKANCWTGDKVVCSFNVAAWRKTPMFDELKREIGDKANDVLPMFQWVGKAPACNADICDLFKMGYMPVALDEYGDGSGCVVGEKILGMRPILKDHYKLVEEGRKYCYVSESEKRAIISKCLEIGLELLKQIGKAMAATSISPSEFDDIDIKQLTNKIVSSYPVIETFVPMRGDTPKDTTTQSSESHWLFYLLIGGGVLAVVALIVFLYYYYH